MAKDRLSRLQKFILFLLSVEARGNGKEPSIQDMMPHSVIWLKGCAMTMLDLDLKKPTKCKTTASMDVVMSRAIWGLEAKGLVICFMNADKKFLKAMVETGKLNKEKEKFIRYALKTGGPNFTMPFPIARNFGLKAKLVQITEEGEKRYLMLSKIQKKPNIKKKGR